MFDPYVGDKINKEKIKDQRIIKFQACIDIEDITNSQIITLPSKYCENFSEDIKDYTKDYYI